MIIIPLPLPGAFFNGSNIKATVAWKVCWHIYEDSQEYFPFRTYIPPSFPSRRAPLGLAGREGGREERRLGLSFSSRLLSSRLFKKGGKRERERERNTSTVKKNHTRDMIVVRQRALNQVGFMRRRSGPGGERGRTLAETRSFEGVLPPLWEGWKMSARPSETLISCSIPAYLFRDLLTYPPTYLHAHHS